MYEFKERQSLLSIVVDDEWNWYQRSAAFEKAFELKCNKYDPSIPKIMSAGNINFRQLDERLSQESSQ